MTRLAMFTAVYGLDEAKAEQMIELMEALDKATPEKRDKAMKLLETWAAEDAEGSND